LTGLGVRATYAAHQVGPKRWFGKRAEGVPKVCQGHAKMPRLVQWAWP
jgi:hypothetical protein